MDASKLTPLPLRLGDEFYGETAVRMPDGVELATFRRAADAEFYILARQAFDIMMEEGWGVHSRMTPDGRMFGTSTGYQKMHRDPFTALVEAKKWIDEFVTRHKAENDNVAAFAREMEF